jgi:peptidoglycan/xylan/chitin deacetylase (PgdA/CDA1 family)
LLRGLPEKVGSSIVNTLFLRYVDSNEEIFARELYMDVTQLRCMVQHGMEIGGHGYKHAWLEVLSKSEQEEEIYSTLGFLTRIYKHEPLNWAMCYPYGSYNNMTLEILKQAKCALGITIYNDLVFDLKKPLELNRLDTTDIPTSKNAAVDTWTQKAQQNR